MRTNRTPVPVATKVVARVPGHAVVGARYEQPDGITTAYCQCGVQTGPAQPVPAALLRAEHLEIHVARDLKMSGTPGQFAGKSIYEQLWDEMDAVYGRLMGGEETMDKGDKHYARGIARALSMMANPYHPDIEAIKAEAHNRWEAGLDEQDLARINAEEG